MKSKPIITFIIILLSTWLAGHFGPWWAPALSIVLVTFILRCTTKQAMLYGAVSLGIVYLGMMLWLSAADKADIIGKTGLLLGGLSPVILMIVNTILGAITGLFSGWLGSAISQVLAKK